MKSNLPRGLFSRRTRLLGSEGAFKLGPQILEIERLGHKVIKCNIGEPDFPLAPHIADEVKRQIDLGQTHYCDPQGVLPLREAVARSVGLRRGIAVGPDRVVVFPGGKPPIALAQQTYCNPGDEVIYPSPGFPIYEAFARYIGLKPVPLILKEERDFSFDGRDLAPLITRRTRLIILNFPSNPTGGVATRTQLEDIAATIQRLAPPQARVFSDEIYENNIFDGALHHSIASVPGMAERTLIVSGASKSYAWTGGRIGWAVFPTAEEAQVFKDLNINYFSCVPAYNQLGAALAIDSPLSPPWIARMVESFRERRDVMLAGLNEIPGVSCRKPGGAFYLFPNVGGVCESLGAVEAHANLPERERGRTSPSTLFQMFLLRRHHVATIDRRSFGHLGSEGQHYLRISIATALDDLKLGLDRIAAAAADRAGFQDFVGKKRRA
jgi:aspartate/methionine/tyrosine aminotransferase